MINNFEVDNHLEDHINRNIKISKGSFKIGTVVKKVVLNVAVTDTSEEGIRIIFDYDIIENFYELRKLKLY